MDRALNRLDRTLRGLLPFVPSRVFRRLLVRQWKDGAGDYICEPWPTAEAEFFTVKVWQK